LNQKNISGIPLGISPANIDYPLSPLYAFRCMCAAQSLQGELANFPLRHPQYAEVNRTVEALICFFGSYCENGFSAGAGDVFSNKA